MIQPSLFFILLIVFTVVFLSSFLFANAEPEYVVTAYVESPNPLLKYLIIPIYYIEYSDWPNYCNEPCAGSVGPAPNGGAAIYIVKLFEFFQPEYGGCTVLWHEILHVKGMNHAEIAKYYPNDNCKNLWSKWDGTS